jgi:Tfp pilus assembly ATPase PilU
MVRLVVGKMGSGKTKTMIDSVNKTAKEAKGLVVCIERGDKLRFDICNAVRLIDSTEFDIKGFQVMRGFITGLYACNFDITDIFVDSLHKVADITDIAELEKFMRWTQDFNKQNGVNFTISVGISEDKLTAYLKELV